MMELFLLCAPKELETLFTKIIDFFETKDFLYTHGTSSPTYIWGSIALCVAMLSLVPLPGTMYGFLLALGSNIFFYKLTGSCNITLSAPNESCSFSQVSNFIYKCEFIGFAFIKVHKSIARVSYSPWARCK